MIYIRSLLGNIWVYGTIIIFVVPFGIFGFIMPKNFYIWALNRGMMPMIHLGLWVFCGLKIEVRGKQHLIQGGKAVYAVKHESALDTYSLTPYIQKGVLILKKGLMMIPFFGWTAKFYGLIPVDRSAGASAMKKMMKEAQNRIDDNRPVIIFPEGHRVKAGTGIAYKPGFYFMAKNLGVPVIPVALNTGLFWPRNSFLRQPGTAVIEFMPAIMPSGDKEEFIKQIENQIESKCAELNQEALVKYPHTKQNYGG